MIRFGYGRTVPWVRHIHGGVLAIAGPDAVELLTPVKLDVSDAKVSATFSVGRGVEVPFLLEWYRSYEPRPKAISVERAMEDSAEWWREWSAHCITSAEWSSEAVVSSLIVLKSLTYRPSGGMVAAVTTSLPERPGGVRNWDYRFCWLRDATFTLYAMMIAGYHTEARAFRDWLLRAIAGNPEQLQILYGLSGERRTTELELPWLSGFEGSRPVRIGNAAADQFQLDVVGELMDCMHLVRKYGIDSNGAAWELQKRLMDFLEGNWRQPDEGIWEVRGPRRHFTHSKVMAWVAADRAVKAVERFGLEGPLVRWKRLRAEICDEILTRGYDADRGSFVQSYEEKDLDASLLLIPLVGFLPARDPRVVSTVKAIERELLDDGLVRRYRPREQVDGLPPGEGVFLACSFWLADNYALQGEHAKAKALFDRLLSLRNDVGLLAEQYDPRTRRMLGNFPQAFSHVALVNCAMNLSRGAALRPAEDRASECSG